MTTKGRPYRYYRCHHVYDKNTSRTCTARYVRGDKLESAVWEEVGRVLADPAVVLQELENQAGLQTDVEQIGHLEGEIKALGEREERLVKLYTLGTISEQTVQKQLEEISRERTALNQRLSNDEVLAVAFQYTYNGQIYQVGEFANGGLDANWLNSKGIPTVTLGAGQHNAHTLKEYVDIGEYLLGCKLALALATAP